MALNKQDFIQQGFDAAQNTAAKTPGHEDSMPIFGEGKSWQAKAFAEGFRQGVTARHERNKGLKVGDIVIITAKTSIGKSQYKPVQTAKKTASLHILALKSEADRASYQQDFTRVDRIMRKVEKLTAKWGF